MLKSNGFYYPENWLKKFEILPKITSTNIVKKLSLGSLVKPAFFHTFNFSHKWLTFIFTTKSGYTLGTPRKIAHTASHAETRGAILSCIRFDTLLPRRSDFQPARAALKSFLENVVFSLLDKNISL